jgi:hypothetical protein
LRQPFEKVAFSNISIRHPPSHFRNKLARAGLHMPAIDIHSRRDWTKIGPPSFASPRTMGFPIFLLSSSVGISQHYRHAPRLMRFIIILGDGIRRNSNFAIFVPHPPLDPDGDARAPRKIEKGNRKEAASAVCLYRV